MSQSPSFHSIVDLFDHLFISPTTIYCTPTVRQALDCEPEKIKEVVRILKILGTPTTLREMGIINDVKSKVEIIAKNIFLEIYDYKNIYKIEDKTVIEEAILEANAIGENS